MTVDERLEALLARHEALTQSVELMSRIGLSEENRRQPESCYGHLAAERRQWPQQGEGESAVA
jgi:hypothetical protein